MSTTTTHQTDTQSDVGVPPTPPATLKQAGEGDAHDTGMTATYSPDDNKLRLYSVRRLDAATYARVKAAGFIWAPKQDLFVAPMWTPAREDLLTELAGEIGDDDTSLVDRAADRAERFDGYKDRRADDAAAAHRAVQSIQSGIPFGQPILVGHHSERHARKDAQRIEDGMRRAVSLWETSEYWKRRAAGALRHAKYKERADVRARRIRTIEADQRKAQRETDKAALMLKLWTNVHDENATAIKRKDGAPTTFKERALFIANRDHVSRCFTLADYPRQPPASQYEGTMGLWSAMTDDVIGPDVAQRIAIEHHKATIAHHARWLAHYANRLDYERAMLAEQGAIDTAQTDIQVGGKVFVGEPGAWFTVLRVNRTGGRIVSVTTSAARRCIKAIGEVKGYEPPTEERAEAARELVKLAPLVNYPGEGFATMTRAQWDKIPNDYKGTAEFPKAEGVGRHRVRRAIGVYARPDAKDSNERHAYPWVFITDAKVTQPPRADGASTGRTAEAIAKAAGIDTQAAQAPVAPTPRPAASPLAQDIAAMRETLRQGVQVVSAPQLFPTPAPLAARMVELGAPQIGQRVLEPSAGTGRLLQALPGVLPACFAPSPARTTRQTAVQAVAVEISPQLVDGLRASGLATSVHCADFLAIEGPGAYVAGDAGQDPAPLGLFDLVLMNPPFANAADILHIEHAAKFLRPGGTLVAICAGGPRQEARLRPMVQAYGGTWEPLPDDTFGESGTNVRTVLLSFTVPLDELPE